MPAGVGLGLQLQGGVPQMVQVWVLQQGGAAGGAQVQGHEWVLLFLEHGLLQLQFWGPPQVLRWVLQKVGGRVQHACQAVPVGPDVLWWSQSPLVLAQLALDQAQGPLWGTHYEFLQLHEPGGLLAQPWGMQVLLMGLP